jgi:hypothetical protein
MEPTACDRYYFNYEFLLRESIDATCIPRVVTSIIYAYANSLFQDTLFEAFTQPKSWSEVEDGLERIQSATETWNSKNAGMCLAAKWYYGGRPAVSLHYSRVVHFTLYTLSALGSTLEEAMLSRLSLDEFFRAVRTRRLPMLIRHLCVAFEVKHLTWTHIGEIWITSVMNDLCDHIDACMLHILGLSPSRNSISDDMLSVFRAARDPGLLTDRSI